MLRSIVRPRGTMALLLALVAAIVLAIRAPVLLSGALGFVGSPGGLQLRGHTNSAVARRAAKAQPPEGMSLNREEDEEDDLEFEDDFSMDGEELDVPEEILEDWDQDKLVREIFQTFQSDEAKGKDMLTFRDTYRIMEFLGVEKADFLSMFTSGDDDGGEGGFGEDDDDDDDFEDDYDADEIRLPGNGKPPPRR
mmetsp:Transcript_129452/g.414928  ORF Transcript_129452/g.414928 Transcript_129452/m.414928 type:complete len:194 (+) Transcript_129452:65-646(+)